MKFQNDSLFPEITDWKKLFTVGAKGDTLPGLSTPQMVHVGNYCSVRVVNGNEDKYPHGWYMNPNEMLRNALQEAMIPIDRDVIHFQICIFEDDKLASIWAQYNVIIGHRLLAWVDLKTIPFNSKPVDTQTDEKAVETKPVAGRGVSEDVVAILKECEIDANSVKLPARQLARELYVAVKKVLEDNQGKWKGGKTQAFIFDRDPREALAGVMETGKSTSIRTKLQAFFTPGELARRVVQYANLKDFDRILEPSAGEGALAEAILDEVQQNNLTNDIRLCELDAHHVGILTEKFGSSKYKHNTIKVLETDFLTTDISTFYQVANKSYGFNKIIMNPPFTKGQDMRHILHAWSMLQKGGRLVAICSEAVRRGETKDHKNFMETFKDATFYEVEAGAFKESGTGVATLILVANKP